MITDAQAGKGSVGKLFTDETLFNNVNQAASNINQLSSEGTKLIYDFRQNPKKYLRIKVSHLLAQNLTLLATRHVYYASMHRVCMNLMHTIGIMQTKETTHGPFLNLIAAAPVAKQEELARLLTARGFSVTQASVSRDLERLGVVKANGRYVSVRPTNGDSGAFGPVTFNEAGDNLIVINCGSGLASAAAVRIDAGAIPEIVGTIAGDDTIFVAVERP